MHRDLLLPSQCDLVDDEPGVGPLELCDDSVGGALKDSRCRRFLARLGVCYVEHLPRRIRDCRLARIVLGECEGDDLALAGHREGGMHSLAARPLYYRLGRLVTFANLSDMSVDMASVALASII